MAAVDTVPGQSNRTRRRHFTSFVKRLANLKSSSSDSQLKKSSATITKNNPYPLSGIPPQISHQQVETVSSRPSGVSLSVSPNDSKSSFPISQTENSIQADKKSAAPIPSAVGETTHFETKSKAGTVTTAAGGQSMHGTGGEGSTFSSPAPSLRSLSTTLTTIQSAHPNVATGTNQPGANTAVQFSHQFPAAPTPASALPSHMVPHTGVPSTYSTATANNLLTDNASILTLASSSKRRRRNSLDTNASVRALAPSSLFGGSRESLPLSVLSGPIPDSISPQSTNLTSVPPPTRPSVGGNFPSEQRTSFYSSSGVPVQASGTSTRESNAPIHSERNSYYANPKGNTGDGGSMRSGRFSHGRNDSVSGSLAGVSTGMTSTLPTLADGDGRADREDSDWQ